MTSLPEILECHARSCPDAPALTDGVIRISYAELHDQVRNMADRLVQSGVRRLGLGGDNSPQWVIADLACRLAEIVVVPMPTFFSAAQRQHLIEQAGLDAIFQAGTAAPGTVSGTDHGALSAVGSADGRLPGPLPATTHKITFTSGSTGNPKGVCLSAGNLDATTEALRERLQSLDIRRHLCVLPLATLLENVAGVYLPLALGAEICLPPLATLGFSGSSQLQVAAFIQGIRAFNPHSLILVPELARLLVQAAQEGALQGHELRFVAVGGGKVARGLLEKGLAAGLPLYEGYGLSESGSVVALNTPADNRPGRVGRPLSHVQVSCRDDGEIVVRGNTFLGYLDQTPPASADCRDSALATVYQGDIGSALETGDRGDIDSAGFLGIEGRSKNLLITAFGRNISPEWLESELLQATPAWQACVYGEGEIRPRALLVCPPQVGKDQLARSLRELNLRLPDYARLATVHVLHQPFTREAGFLTGNGRLQRQAILRALPDLVRQASYCLKTEPGEITMSFFEKLQSATVADRRQVTEAPVVAAIRDGRLGRDGYVYFLSQAYHHVKHTAPLMMACGGRLPERLEFVRKALVEYIKEEYGHHEWILNDIAACGHDPQSIRHSEADLPMQLMVSWLYDQMNRGNPMALFGMVQVLEGTSVELATPLGQTIQNSLGLPRQAFSYLYSHGTLDQEHFEFFRTLMDAVTDPADQQAIITAARICYRLYGDMLRAIPLQSTSEVHHDAAA